MNYAELVRRLEANIGRALVGKPQVVRLAVIGLLARGHLLIEDVPGVGKTTLAKGLAHALQADFKRVQFTPDLLPADIVGSSIFNPKEAAFDFKPGPVFANILLADEVNRASPRTQSSLLEAMSEGQVTVDGKTYPLPRPFIVLATQNPVEFHGTYPLPEAQLDRFAVQMDLGYPDRAHEVDMLYSQVERHPLEGMSPILTCAEVMALQQEVRRVTVARPVADYIVKIVAQTRQHPSVRAGVSPRGSLVFQRTAQARAAIAGRDHVTPDDVKAVAVPVLSHRLMLETKAKYSGVRKADVVRGVLGEVPVPV